MGRSWRLGCQENTFSLHLVPAPEFRSPWRPKAIEWFHPSWTSQEPICLQLEGEVGTRKTLEAERLSEQQQEVGADQPNEKQLDADCLSACELPYTWILTHRCLWLSIPWSHRASVWGLDGGRVSGRIQRMGSAGGSRTRVRMNSWWCWTQMHLIRITYIPMCVHQTKYTVQRLQQGLWVRQTLGQVLALPFTSVRSCVTLSPSWASVFFFHLEKVDDKIYHLVCLGD